MLILRNWSSPIHNILLFNDISFKYLNKVMLNFFHFAFFLVYIYLFIPVISWKNWKVDKKKIFFVVFYLKKNGLLHTRMRTFKYCVRHSEWPPNEKKDVNIPQYKLFSIRGSLVMPRTILQRYHPGLLQNEMPVDITFFSLPLKPKMLKGAFQGWDPEKCSYFWLNIVGTLSYLQIHVSSI